MTPLALLARLWAAPCTLIGLALALPLSLPGGSRRWHDGVLEISLPPQRDWLVKRLPFAAITFGHVVFGTSPDVLARLRVHEHEHVHQYERWGPAFLPAYVAASAWQWCRGRGAWRDNPFEVAARAAERRAGERVEAASRPVARAGGCAPAAGSSRSSA